MATPQEIIRCRTIGHAWEVVEGLARIFKRPPVEGETVLSLRCTSCSTERYDRVDAGTGVVLGRKYVHPLGYLRAKDAADERPTKYEWRRQFLYVAGLTNREGRLKR